MTYFDFLAIAFPALCQGAVITLKMSAISLLLGLAVGIPLAFARVYGGKFLSGLSLVYSELLRDTPILVQLFIVYYGLPQFGLVLSPMVAGCLTMGLNSAAYQIEYFRGAILSIGPGQMMAARSMGMSTPKAILVIILPQVFRIVLPTWANEAISMIKNTSVCYLIAVPELMTQAKILIARFYNTIESYSTVAVFYLVIIGVMSVIFALVEKRLKIPGLAIEKERK